AVLRRIVEAAHLVRAAATGTPVQQHDRLAVGIAALLVVEDVTVVDAERAGVEGFDLGVQRAHADAASCLETRPVYQPVRGGPSSSCAVHCPSPTRSRPSRSVTVATSTKPAARSSARTAGPWSWPCSSSSQPPGTRCNGAAPTMARIASRP